MAGDLILKQLHAVIDKRTSPVCLNANGQIRPVDQPYDTLNGQYDSPPFHVHCRSISVPWMPGFVNDARAQANAEIQNRSAAQRAVIDGRHPMKHIPDPKPLDLRAPSKAIVPREGGPKIDPALTGEARVAVNRLVADQQDKFPAFDQRVKAVVVDPTLRKRGSAGEYLAGRREIVVNPDLVGKPVVNPGAFVAWGDRFDSVFAHETGHAIWHEADWTARVQVIDEVAAALKIKPPVWPLMPGASDAEIEAAAQAWLKSHRTTIRRRVSSYAGASTIQEFWAEVWVAANDERVYGDAMYRVLRRLGLAR